MPGDRRRMNEDQLVVEQGDNVEHPTFDEVQSVLSGNGSAEHRAIQSHAVRSGLSALPDRNCDLRQIAAI